MFVLVVILHQGVRGVQQNKDFEIDILYSFFVILQVDEYDVLSQCTVVFALKSKIDRRDEL
jgi:hypothetical protein